MLGHGAIGQFAIGQWTLAGSTEVISPDKWYVALSEPKRFLADLKPGLQQFSAFNPQPFVSFAWYGLLSEPVRFKPDLGAARQPFLAQAPRLLPTPTISGVMLTSESGDAFFGGGTVFNPPARAKVGMIELAPQPKVGLIEKSS